MKWVRNALLGLMRDAVRAELQEQRAAETAHVTELVSTLHKATDELSHALSREAMRKARQLKVARQDDGDGSQAAPAPATPQLDGLTPKQAARLRMARMLSTPPARSG